MGNLIEQVGTPFFNVARTAKAVILFDEMKDRYIIERFTGSEDNMRWVFHGSSSAFTLQGARDRCNLWIEERQ